MECPVCCDVFSAPKLLSCRHSFCARCLKEYTNKTKIRNYIKCPLCRQQCNIPKGGVNNLFDNYFVSSDHDKDNPNDNLTDCVLEGNLSDDSDYDVIVPLSVHLAAGNIQTKFKATFVSAFSTGGEDCINSIYPVSETEVWTISDSGPDLVLFDIHGQELKKLLVNERFCDMILRKDDILIAMPEDCKIGSVSISNGKFSDFAFTGHCRVFEMSSFPDGSIVVVGRENVDVKTERRGKIQLFSQFGDYLVGLEKDNAGIDPIAVAVNPILGTFSVTDSKNRCVYTLFRNGGILSIYNGVPSRLLMSVNPFIPYGICYDQDGNLIITDGGSGVLHVLDSFGSFQGLVLTNHEDGFGEAFSIAVDKAGKLWIGDENNAMIGVFRISSYINELRSDDD